LEPEVVAGPGVTPLTEGGGTTLEQEESVIAAGRPKLTYEEVLKLKEL